MLTFLKERQPISEPLISGQNSSSVLWHVEVAITLREIEPGWKLQGPLQRWSAAVSPLCWRALGFPLTLKSVDARIHFIGTGMSYWKNMDYTMYNIHLGGPQLYNPRRTSTWRWRTWRGQPRSWSGRWAFGTVVLGKWNGAKVKPAECWWTSDAQMIANFSLTSPRWLWGWWWSLRRQQGRRSL